MMRVLFGALAASIVTAGTSVAGLEPGMTLDPTTAAQAKDLLPAEILKHCRIGLREQG